MSSVAKHCPWTPAPAPLHVFDPSVYQMGPLTAGGDVGSLVCASVVNITALNLGSELNGGPITSFSIPHASLVNITTLNWVQS
jgi:hypothetical protein